jgi:hypothetical protein
VPAAQCPDLDIFLEAAASGPLLWASEAEGRTVICSGSRQAAAAGEGADVEALFLQALRDRYCSAACVAAERACHLPRRPCHQLPSHTVLRAAACAESVQSFYLAEMAMLQFEVSAALGGWRFRLACQELGLGPARLPAPRCAALDIEMSNFLRGALPVNADLPT